MRADRLLSLLMLLQTRGRMTAGQLARELEVSERTIYRDIEALSMAGVPIYGDRGPGGGCALLEHYRTNLTGLNEDEIQALFMLSIPAPLVELGVNQELKGALLKLAAALPGNRHHDEQYVRQRIHLDFVAWFQSEELVPHLRTLHHAIWENRKLHLRYSLPFNTQVTRTVKPYGLVAKTNIWYLVYERDNLVLVHRVSTIIDAIISDEAFDRPPDFNLALFWDAWCVEFEKTRPHFRARVRAAPELIPRLSQQVSRPLYHAEDISAPDKEGWATLTLTFETFESARMIILSFGQAIEVLEPLPLRLSVLDFATQVVKFYGRLNEATREGYD